MSATNPEARRWKVGDTLHPGEWRNLPEGAEYDVTHHYRVDPVAGGVEVGSIRTITKLPEPLTWTESFDKARRYSYVVRWSDTISRYVATVDEFPALSIKGTVAGNTLLGLIGHVADTLIEMSKRGETPPEPLPHNAERDTNVATA